MIFKHYQGSAPVVISDSESDVEVAQDSITHVKMVCSLCHYNALFILNTLSGQ